MTILSRILHATDGFIGKAARAELAQFIKRPYIRAMMNGERKTVTAFWAGGKSAVSHENGEFTLWEFTDTFGR